LGSLTGTHGLSRLSCRRSKANSQPRSRPWRVVADTPRTAWLVGLPHACRKMLLIGSRHRRDSCSEAYRFARSGSVPADPKVDLDVPDSSLGVHRSPLRRHDGRCVHCPPGPSPRLRFGTATSRTCSALAVPPGFSGFLRSEWIRRSTRSTVRGFVAPRSRPGVHHVSDTRPDLSIGRRPEGRGPRGPSRRRPLWRVPFEAFPSPAAFDHAVTAPRPFGRGRVHRLVCLLAVSSLARVRVATVRGPCSSTSRLCSAGESVASRATLPRRARSMLPWALDRRVPMLPRSRAAQRSLDISPGGPIRFGVPRPERRGKAGCFGPVWLLRPAPQRTPKGGARGIAVAPASPEGAASAASHHGPRRTGGMPVELPREESHRVGPHPKAQVPTSSRRISEETRSRPGAAPKSGVQWFELVLRILPRSPAYLMPRPLAAHAHTRRCERLRATRAHPEGCRVELPGVLPKERTVERAGGATRRWALGGS
jgi:hypothetical protein